jgi:hypothetical protein
MPKPILDYRDDDSPLWPARCRGYLEGRQASDCLASVELARLRAENEELRGSVKSKQNCLDAALEGWNNANARIERLRAALEAAKPFLYLLWPRVRLPKGVRRPEGWEWELFKRRAAAALKAEP